MGPVWTVGNVDRGDLRLAVATDRSGTLVATGLRGELGPVQTAAQKVGASLRPGPVPDPVGAQLRAYLSGELRAFSLPYDTRGTAFQREVWAVVARIPYGETRTYGQVARELGRSGAARAVGLANGRNPVAPVVPCHRVVGSDGRLTGYAGGLELKRRLLQLESGTRGRAQLECFPTRPISGGPWTSSCAG